MQFEPEGAYLMPVSFGEVPYQAVARYDDSWNVAVVYLTDKDALAALLPPPFEPADEPIVTMFYTKCNKVDFLAGGGYNLMGVNLAAAFNGTEDHVEGSFAAVLWENDTRPILLGRELLGAPKLFGDIPDPFRIEDTWRVQTSENGHLLLDMTVENAQPAGEDAVAMMNAATNASPWLGWRYFPRPDGRGTALSEPILIGAEATIDEAWVGSGSSVRYGDVTWEANPLAFHILPKLQTLVVREYRAGVVTHGSSKLLISENRVLR